jgi:hypothetical protein
MDSVEWRFMGTVTQFVGVMFDTIRRRPWADGYSPEVELQLVEPPIGTSRGALVASPPAELTRAKLKLKWTINEGYFTVVKPDYHAFHGGVDWQGVVERRAQHGWQPPPDHTALQIRVRSTPRRTCRVSFEAAEAHWPSWEPVLEALQVELRDWLTAPDGNAADGAEQTGESSEAMDARAPSPSLSLQDRPWETIPVSDRDRSLLEMWWKGETTHNIGLKLGMDPRTVTNRLHKLRKEYGDSRVPNRRRGRQQPT